MVEAVIRELQMDGGSGLAKLQFKDGTSVLLESGFGVRQLLGWFDGNLKGRKIRYAEEDGVMVGFEPVG